LTREDRQLDEPLSRAIREGRATWPEVCVDPEAVAAHLAAHVDDWAAIDPRHHADIYLAAACALGDAAALAAFEEQYMAGLDGTLRALVGDAHVSEVKQIVRHRILVSQDGRAPRIATYAGRSSLRAWVRACALRAGSTLLRGQRPGGDGELDWLGVPVEFADPCLAQVRRRYAPAFKRALQSALADIPLRDRSVLRYVYIEGMAMDEIGRIYRVHRTTALRWLEAARRRVLTRVRRTLLKELGLAGREIESLMRDLRSHLDLSLERLLAEAVPDAPDAPGSPGSSGSSE
jgi:RNA polymerase sigma-70 factor, ECF subfamily